MPEYGIIINNDSVQEFMKKRADLYMKSGMYVTEIVTRLYQRKRMKSLYPDGAEKQNQILAGHVHAALRQKLYIKFACAIFSDSVTRYTLRKNIRLCDTLEYAKNGTLDTDMRKLFDL